MLHSNLLLDSMYLFSNLGMLSIAKVQLGLVISSRMTSLANIITTTAILKLSIKLMLMI